MLPQQTDTPPPAIPSFTSPSPQRQGVRCHRPIPRSPWSLVAALRNVVQHAAVDSMHIYSLRRDHDKGPRSTASDKVSHWPFGSQDSPSSYRSRDEPHGPVELSAHTGVVCNACGSTVHRSRHRYLDRPDAKQLSALCFPLLVTSPWTTTCALLTSQRARREIIMRWSMDSSGLRSFVTSSIVHTVFSGEGEKK